MRQKSRRDFKRIHRPQYRRCVMDRFDPSCPFAEPIHPGHFLSAVLFHNVPATVSIGAWDHCQGSGRTGPSISSIKKVPQDDMAKVF